MANTSLYPLSLKEELQKQFVGKSIEDVAGPVAVFDLSKIQRNCNRMLEAVDILKFGWRAHIKTHKVQAALVSEKRFHAILKFFMDLQLTRLDQ
jgi:hypothetical protein